MRFDEWLDRRRKEVETALDGFLNTPPAPPPVITEAMRYSLLGGGKRLRPLIVLATAEGVAQAVGASEAAARDAAMPAACAIEMIHAYSLIHDDLPSMDDDDLRRGRPTSHVVHGEGMAILAGDGLQAEAFALLAREPQSTDAVIVSRKLRVFRTIADAAGTTGLVGGQAIDLQAAGLAPGHEISLDADALRAMHARKTGALIRASAASGAVMAGAEGPALDAIDVYADSLGLAFQIVDDILDVEGTDAALGKTAGKDALAEKPTYPSLFGVERSRSLAHESVERAKQALTDAGLAGGWLGPIADWVISRNS